MSDLQRIFCDPPREFGFMPFWFWNDDLDDAGIVRQLREMHAKGFGGVIVHPRNGLSRRIGYLTPEFFRLMRVAVEESARLGMKVILYDEAGYPSGSCQGRVVAENPDWAAKCIFVHPDWAVKGPARGFLRPNPGRAIGYKLVTVVAGCEVAKGRLDPDTLRCLTWDAHEVVAYDLPAGDWRIVAVWEGHSGGCIRGVFEEEEDYHALAPPAGDILREDAVACFIRRTHDRYYTHLKEHFGLLGDYGRRLCWLLSDGAQICETGIVSDGDSLAWEAEKRLCEFHAAMAGGALRREPGEGSVASGPA